MAYGNAGKGREVGSRNKRTIALMALAEAGETPVAFALRLMRNEATPPELRVACAKMAAAYCHPRPQPEPRLVSFELPEKINTETIGDVHQAIMKATSKGELAVEDARDISAMLETHRRIIETVELEQRISRLEKEQSE
jgi:hypothetical protein